MDDETLKDQITKIYKKHRKSLDLIFEQVRFDVVATEFQDATNRFFDKHSDSFIKIASNPKQASFIPASLAWLKEFPRREKYWEKRDYFGPFLVFVKNNKDKICFQFYLGPLGNEYNEKRLEIGNKLLGALGKKTKDKIDSFYTRIYEIDKSVESESLTVDDYLDLIESTCASEVFRQNLAKLEPILVDAFPKHAGKQNP